MKRIVVCCRDEKGWQRAVQLAAHGYWVSAVCETEEDFFLAQRQATYKISGTLEYTTRLEGGSYFLLSGYSGAALLQMAKDISQYITPGNTVLIEGDLEPYELEKIGEVLWDFTGLIMGKDLYIAHVSLPFGGVVHAHCIGDKTHEYLEPFYRKIGCQLMSGEQPLAHMNLQGQELLY